MHHGGKSCSPPAQGRLLENWMVQAARQSCGVERSNAPSCANVAVHIMLKAPGQTHKFSHEGGKTGHREPSSFSREVGERETEACYWRCFCNGFFRVHMILKKKSTWKLREMAQGMPPLGASH